MVQGIDFHGRLCRADGEPAEAGTYHLCFTLHPDPTTRRRGWTEEHREVDVDAAGRFSVVLGTVNELRPRHLRNTPRWVSVRRVLHGEQQEEQSPRIPITGNMLLLTDLVQRLLKRVEALDERLRERTHPTGGELKERLDRVEERLDVLGGPALGELRERLDTLDARLEPVDGQDGRLDLLEDRMEELDGPDGDIVDLNERVDALEEAGTGEALLVRLAKAEKVHRQLARRIASLEARLPLEEEVAAAE